MIIKKTACILFFWTVATISVANTFVVTHTADNGSGSLREAITIANATPAASHSIHFNIPASDPNFDPVSGIWKITPFTPLPYITRAGIVIDGTTQTAFGGDTNPFGPELYLFGNGNIDYGFGIFNASGISIRGFTVSRFIIGIQVLQLMPGLAQNNVIAGNYIGTTPNGTDTAGNYIGIEVFGGASGNRIGGDVPADRNLVSGNNHIGIRVASSNNNVITGNFVGTDRTGTVAVRNYDGISIEGTASYNLIGGGESGKGNLVSGNVAYGIPVFGAGCTGNIIRGNLIGTDISGSDAIPNTYGVLFDDGASFNILGGRHAGEGNLISGNSGYGVFIYNNSTNSDTVVGNLIGTNLSGNSALPNANGIVIDGIPRFHLIDSNVISGNYQQGIVIHATGTDYNRIFRNRIGTDMSGTQPIPNGIDGIRIAEGPRNNMVGAPGMGNIIAYNGGNGITVMTDGDYYNTFSANSVFYNAGLGIDLYPEGVTPNDAGDPDAGPNFTMNFPLITSAAFNPVSGNYDIQGNINTPAPQTVTIEIFESDNDPSGYGQGQRFIASVHPDAAGNFNASVNGIWGGYRITATATDSAGNTSEFAASAMVSGLGDAGKNDQGMVVCPNPAGDELRVGFGLATEAGNYWLLSIDGSVCRTGTFGNKAANSLLHIPLEGLGPGIYQLIIATGGSQRSIPFAIGH